METKCDFQIIQNGIKYIVNLSIIGNNLEVKCREYLGNNNKEFNAIYFHEQIKEFSPIFNSTTSIYEDFEIFKKAILSKKVSIKKDENNDINLTFILEEDYSNQNIYLPLELNNNFDKFSTSVEYMPPRKLPTIKVNMAPESLRRPTIYIDNDGNQIPKNQFYNNIHNIIRTQNTSFIQRPKTREIIINKNTLCPNSQRTQIFSSPQRKNIHQNYIGSVKPISPNSNNSTASTHRYSSPDRSSSPYYSPYREKIEYFNNGSPSKNIFNYTQQRRKNNNITNINNKLNINKIYKNNNLPNINDVPKINSRPNINNIGTNRYNNNNLSETQNCNNNGNIVNQIKNLQNELSKIKDVYEQTKSNVNNLIEKIKEKDKEIEKLKSDNQILIQNQGLKAENDSVLEQFKNERDRIENEFEEYKKQKEEKIQELLDQINNLTEENEKYKLELEKYKKRKLRLVKGDIIQDNNELEFLTKNICKEHKKITLNLLYKASVDSDKAQAFHNKCDTAKCSLVLIKSKNNKRFGGFTSCSWEGNGVEKNDEKAFVFSLDKKKIYNIIPNEKAIGCYPKCGPVFLGCQIRIHDNAFTNGGTTFEKQNNYNTEEDFELSGGEKKYGVEEIEVYGIELE